MKQKMYLIVFILMVAPSSFAQKAELKRAYIEEFNTCQSGYGMDKRFFVKGTNPNYPNEDTITVKYGCLEAVKPHTFFFNDAKNVNEHIVLFKELRDHFLKQEGYKHTPLTSEKGEIPEIEIHKFEPKS